MALPDRHTSQFPDAMPHMRREETKLKIETDFKKKNDFLIHFRWKIKDELNVAVAYMGNESINRIVLLQWNH